MIKKLLPGQKGTDDISYELIENLSTAFSEGKLQALEEMIAKFSQARNKRDSLATTSGRLQTQESLTGANDLFDELDRMADKVEDNHAGIQATEEIDTEAALEELKRRMKPES